MSESILQESAKIYQFPAGGRSALGGRRHDVKPATDVAAPRVANAALGSAWYHEAAIQEADRAHKN